MGEAFRIRIDREACRGSRQCVHRAPATFALDADDRARVADARGDPPDAILTAARSCPNFAIRVHDGERELV